jgi:hypothetical protein
MLRVQRFGRRIGFGGLGLSLAVLAGMMLFFAHAAAPPASAEDNPNKDILITVQEASTGSLMFGVGVNSDSGLTGSIVLNERNFDILRPPTSFEQILVDSAMGDVEKDVLIKVHESRTASLMFGVGVNSDSGLTGSIRPNESGNLDQQAPDAISADQDNLNMAVEPDVPEKPEM